MKIAPRQVLYGLAVIGLLSALAEFEGRHRLAPLAAAPASVQPLDRVPADAGVFAHINAGELWNHALLVELRKSYGVDAEKIQKEAEKAIGLSLDNIATATFHYPKFPSGPGDEQLFIVHHLALLGYQVQLRLEPQRLS